MSSNAISATCCPRSKFVRNIFYCKRIDISGIWKSRWLLFLQSLTFSGMGSLALVCQVQGPTCISCCLRPICVDLPFSWKLQISLEINVFVHVESLSEKVYSRSIFSPQWDTESHSFLPVGELGQQSFWSKWSAFVCLTPHGHGQSHLEPVAPEGHQQSGL